MTEIAESNRDGGGQAARRVAIAALGAQGDGIAAAPDAGPAAGGAALFIPYALPGEVWRIGSDGAATLETARPDRHPGRCPHFGDCGGCVAHHMPADLYREWKRKTVADAFRHRGLEIDLAPTIEVPAQSRRRAVLAVARSGGDVRIGFRARASHRVVPISKCAVLTPALLAGWPAIAELARILVPEAAETRCAVLAAETGLAVDLSGPRLDATPARLAAASAVAERYRLAEISLDREPLLTRAPPTVRCAGVAVTVPPAAFLQAVEAAEEAMRGLVLAGVGRARRVADLFSGVGPFTLALARTARVLAIDTERALLEALQAAIRRSDRMKPVETRVRDLFREPLARKELEGFDAVVLDPPRAGAEAQVERLARSDVPVVVMVSCNPATLARDCRRLVDGGYRLGPVTPIDQFLWSPHVECVVRLAR